ncbi:MAG: lysophospholipid acyltransferase family protein, partial [Bacillota bacterium]|nr:lysophospholipid acyltransferase family protein [Bacillota bacterium]
MVFFAFIKTLLVFLYLLIILLLTLPYLLIVHFSKKRWILADRYVRGLVKSAVFLAGIRYEIRGEPLHQAPTLYVGNHVSNIDVAVAIAVLPTPKAFIAKIEMKKIPILMWWMHQIGCVFLDRNNLRQQVKTLKTAQENMAKGLSYLVFP